MATTAEAKRVSRTRNDLPAETRAQMVDLCNAALADCLDLSSQTKQAHWNVRGPHFYSLHLLFDKIHDEVSEYVDLIAERAAQLGGQVRGTARMAAEASRLPEYPADIRNGVDHVTALSEALSTFGRTARQAIDTADEADDKDTADVFTEISRGIDQWLWFVEAHQQAEK